MSLLNSLKTLTLAQLLISSICIADWARKPDVPILKNENGYSYYDHNELNFFTKITKHYPQQYDIYDLSFRNPNRIPDCSSIETGFEEFTRYWDYSYSVSWGTRYEPSTSCFYSLVDVAERPYRGGIGPGYEFQYLFVKNYYFPSIDKHIACSISVSDHTYYENGLVNLTWIIPPVGWITTDVLENNAREFLLFNNVIQDYYRILNSTGKESVCDKAQFATSFKKAFENSTKIQKSTLEYINSKL